MAISTTTDLIAGVLNAAVPARAADAAARLGAKCSGIFARELADVAPALPDPSGDMTADVPAAAQPPTSAAAQERRAAQAHGEDAEPYRKFEAFLLGSAFEAILPPAQSGVFGDGFAGSIWRSMAAERLGSLFADRGGLGIARMLGDGDGRADTAAAQNGQWPYYESGASGLGQG